MKRSVALYLLREGCNAAELAAYFGLTRIQASRAIKALEICVRRRTGSLRSLTLAVDA